VYRVGRHGGGEVGDAAGAFEGRGDDDFEAAGAGAQGEFAAGEPVGSVSTMPTGSASLGACLPLTISQPSPP